MSKRIAGTIYALPGIMLAIGVKTVFLPCIHTDGSAAACSVCGQWIFILALVISAVALIRAFLSRKVRPLTDIILLLTCVFLLFIPGLTGTCMMNTMRCNMLMKPFSIAVVVIGLAVYGFCLFRDLKASKEK